MGAGRLYFEPLVAPWAILLGALALSAAVYAYYIRWDEGVQGRRRVALGALRLGGFALAIFILAGAVTKREEVLSRGRPLAVLLDTSESMSERDCCDSGAGERTRLSAARDALVGSVERLQEAFDLKVYTFNSAAGFLPPIDGGRRQWERRLADIYPEGTATALGDALSQASPRAPGGAVLVLSDGASNSGRTLAAAAEDLAARGIKVFAVPFGRSGRPNVTIKRVLGPGLLLAGEPSAFFAEVEFSGAVTGPARIVLKKQGKVVATAEAQPAGTASLVRLNFTPHEEGDLVYQVEADAFPSEENTDDNRLERTVHVAKEKLQVLYIEENPRWEYRFLKNAILRDDRISPKLLLRFADRDLSAADYNITRLPTTRQELFAFDVVVIGDVDPAFFLPRDLENLRAFVSEGGGGLLFVAGSRWDPARYEGTILGELCPGDAVGEARLPAGGAAIALTDAGVANPALSLSAADQKEFWRALPKISWMLEVKPRAGAQVLAESVPGALPVILEERFGRGRTVLIATDELWRWRRRVGDRYIYRLWAQLVRYLGARRLGGGQAPGELVIAADSFALGESVEATAYIENGLGMPFDEPLAKGFLEDADGRRQDVAFSRTPEGRGLYRARFPAGAPGGYTLYARGPAGFISRGFTVSDKSLEALSRRPDVTALDALARATGGSVLAPDEIGRILDILPAKGKTTTTTVRTSPVWASYWLLVPLVACFCLEWLLRKRWDLM